ncbi:hypothetical protein GQX74_013049 [Glossina fuscipes]|nr:hypothetical protein GQX74_013049 [Glossina fuscipes]
MEKSKQYSHVPRSLRHLDLTFCIFLIAIVHIVILTLTGCSIAPKEPNLLHRSPEALSYINMKQLDIDLRLANSSKTPERFAAQCGHKLYFTLYMVKTLLIGFSDSYGVLTAEEITKISQSL